MTKNSNSQLNGKKMTKDEILESLISLISEVLPNISSGEIQHIPFLEMGANSLILMEMMRTISNQFKVTLVIRQFFEQLTTIDDLASYLEENQSINTDNFEDNTNIENIPQQSYLPDIKNIDISEASSELELIFAQQLQITSNTMSEVIKQQLDFLNKNDYTKGVSSAVSKPVTKKSVSDNLITKAPKSAVSPQLMLSPLEIRARGLTKRQQNHLESLITKYTERTKNSKKLTQKYRSVLADSRASVGFRFTTKEMLYPIIGKKAKGARIWDVDDNEYIDITMGQGVTLFGHHPDFIDEALASQPKDVIQLGPRDMNVGEAAKILTELTGFDRVTFTNSGTEAVMAALRLARAATNKYKIIMFENSYHGHSDGTLGRPLWQNGNLYSEPAASGIPPESVANILTLEYDTEKALDYISSHANELAAVIVEPVQSRRPDLQPKEFLHNLRKITQQNNIVLIFDEMITGFRIHPGGAQAWFGINADIATYGKVIGGGMPIGVIAGKSEIMDRIDGGMWDYGDNSYPQVERVAFGGTFCQHPLTMTTTLATLRHLKENSPNLQEQLNKKTEKLANTLNDFFKSNDIPIDLVYFGSQFRFAFSSNLELLFYHLMQKGVFIWEWRNYFLSTAHTDEDVDFIINAVKESVEEMKEGDFLPSNAKTKISIPNDESIIPLTEAQKQLYALSLISKQGSIAYNICNVVKLKGNLDISALKQAVSKLINRHESLRTYIKNHTHQEVLSNTSIEIPLVNFSNSLNKDEKINEWIKNKNITPFDLNKGPLFQPYILIIDEQEHWLVLTAHHILVDGMSINVILQNIAAIYNSIKNNNELPLDLPMQFKEYVQWRYNEINTANENYWLKQLSGNIPVLDLPTDRAHPPLKTFNGNRHTVFLDEQLCDNLLKLSNKNGCTSFMIFLSIYTLWLHRLTKKDEIIVGIPVAGRPENNRSNSLVGYCTHILPMQSNINWNQTFLQYLIYIRGVFLDSFQHQDYPFANLINKLQLRRDGTYSPIVSTIFNLDSPGKVPVFEDIEADWIPQPIHFTPFDLTFNLTEIEKKYVLDCDYNTDIFEENTIKRFVGNYQTLMYEILKKPDQKVFKISLLNEKQLNQQLFEWNNTKSEYRQDKCFHQIFEEQVEKFPNEIAAVYKDKQLTYSELNKQANHLAHYLKDLNITCETIVGICLERSLELIIGIMGILKSGAAYLPLDISYPSARLKFMIDDSKAKVLITKSSIIENLNIESQVICLDKDWNKISKYDDNNPNSPVKPDNMAYVIYTSGSTGKPKGTMIIHRGLMNYLSWASNEYNVVNGPGTPVNSSISFDATITSLFTPFMAGKRIELLPEDVPEVESLNNALSNNINWSLVKITPAHLDLLNTLLPIDKIKKQTRAFILGGEALYSKTLSMWTQHCPETRLINEYGPTETVVGCCIYEVNPDELEEGSVPIGRPIANTQLYILDDRLQPLPIGVPGELYIGGDGVARGYLNREELTNEKFIANPFMNNRIYKTGDIARYREDGIIEYLGRIDNQVKIRGYRVETGEIESLLNQYPDVSENVIIIHSITSQDIRIIAFFVSNSEQKIETVDIKNFLSDQLPSYMIPSAFVQLKSIPLTSNGKVDRKALPIPENMRVQNDVVFISPENESEKIIAEIWKKVLRVNKVGVNENFFELGGHSLLIPQLYEFLVNEFKNKEFTAIDLFKYPTIRAFVKFLEKKGDDDNKAENIKQLARRQKMAFKMKKRKMKKNF